jgi:hypothetical protein
MPQNDADDTIQTIKCHNEYQHGKGSSGKASGLR